MTHGYSGPAYQRWRIFQWIVIPTGMLSALVLGAWGFSDYARIHHMPTTIWSCLYSSLQLFILHLPHLEPPVPLSLDLARFLAPIVLGYSAVQTFFGAFRHLIHMGCLLFWRDHVIVCGLSQKAFLLARGFRASGHRVVVIEQNPDHPFLPAVNEADAVVLYGDATNGKLLKRAGVLRCRYLVAVTDKDATNVEVAVRAHELACASSAGRGRSIRCFVHVSEPELRAALRRDEIAFAGRCDRVQIKPIGIDPYENGARLLFQRYPLDYRHIPEHDVRCAHLIVVYFGQTGQNVLMQAAKIAHFANGRQLLATVLHDQDLKRPPRETLLARAPCIERVCDLRFEGFSTKDPGLTDRLLALCREPDTLPTVVFCHPEDTWNLSEALKLQRVLGEREGSLAVRMTSRTGFTLLLTGPGLARTATRHIQPFGMVEDIYSREMLIEEDLDRLAQRIQEGFLNGAKAKGRTPEQDGALREWDELADVYRDSNRQQADHIPIKLRAMGCHSGPPDSVGEIVREIPERFVEVLARMEHNRWCAERLLADWTYAPGKKNEAAKTSPHLVSWDKLDDETRDYDLMAVKAIPALVESVGQRIYRTQAPDL